MNKIKNSAILILEDGAIFHGYQAGKKGTTTGELCFNTGMTGYQEVFTDPSYFGQVLLMTNDHIGNYGITKAEVESDAVTISGLVCRDFSEEYSRIKATQNVQEYFEENNIVGIQGVDTRAIVRYIRDKGAMNCIISSESDNIDELKAKLALVPNMNGLELSSKVTTTKIFDYNGDDSSRIRVAVLDLGIKKNILRNLASRGCSLRVFPSNTSFEEMQTWGPDGYFISNGPGDPAALTKDIETVKQIVEKNIPLFGICLGHQVLALASGISTHKMHNGHRGLNHPVKNIITGQCEITSQNHGFEVNRNDIEKSSIVEITHVNLNDGTIEGIKRKDKMAFSVQYHPESSPGPHDSRYLFDQFIELIERSRIEIV
ncbi:MAG: glutamine-hydrolyzing carbamoyl-phosphate synthase small subunit [Bacteroidetes bacterium]|nr:glutamine-hydrolyzing carbamoyl-phosphate synthase small subunit [Bacteroidota bacterium]